MHGMLQNSVKGKHLQLANSYVPDLVVRQAQCNSIWAPTKKTPTQGCNPRYTTPSRWLLGPAVPRKQTSSANRACTLAIMLLWYVYFTWTRNTINYYMYITCIFALHIKFVIPGGEPKNVALDRNTEILWKMNNGKKASYIYTCICWRSRRSTLENVMKYCKVCHKLDIHKRPEKCDIVRWTRINPKFVSCGEDAVKFFLAAPEWPIR